MYITLTIIFYPKKTLKKSNYMSILKPFNFLLFFLISFSIIGQEYLEKDSPESNGMSSEKLLNLILQLM